MEQNTNLEEKRIEEIVEEEIRKMKKEEDNIEEGKTELGEEENAEISRRDFLKKTGIGLGLGALSLIPGASALNIKSGFIDFYSGGTDLEFEVDSNGNITVHGTWNLNGNNINNVNKLTGTLGKPSNTSKTGNTLSNDYAYGVDVVGGYAFVADNDYLSVFDVSNSGSPSKVGNASSNDSALGVDVVGGYAFVADWSAGLTVFDVSNPSSPSKVANVSSYSARGVDVSGSYAFVADYSSGLSVFDVSSPGSPSKVANVSSSGYARGVDVSGSYAFVADYSSGLTVFDVNSVDFTSSSVGALEADDLVVNEELEVGESVQVMGSVTANSKNFLHETENGLIRYSSREAGSARVVYDSTVWVEGETFIEFPEDFRKVVSEKSPGFNVQVPEDVEVRSVSCEGLILVCERSVEVDLSVSAVRDGFEDQKVFLEDKA